MPDLEYRAVLLFGGPGVGKGTQGKRLGSAPHYFHLSSGEMFRSLDPDSPTEKMVRDYFERGELVPDDLTIRIWREYVAGLVASKRFDPAHDTLVLDGIPRNVSQCRMLEHDVRVVRVVHLSSSNEDAMVARLKRRAQIENRKDDADEKVIRRRLEVYRRESRPVLGYYPQELLLEVDALGAPDEVAAAIMQGMASP